MPSSAIRGFPGDASGKEPACQCRRHEGCVVDPWTEKSLWRRKRQSTQVFLPRESPWTEEPGGLQSIGLQRIGHNWRNLACTYKGRSIFLLFMASRGVPLSLSVASNGPSSLPHIASLRHSHSCYPCGALWRHWIVQITQGNLPISKSV